MTLYSYLLLQFKQYYDVHGGRINTATSSHEQETQMEKKLYREKL